MPSSTTKDFLRIVYIRTAMADLNPLLLAANTPDPDPRLLPLLRSKPELASKQDSHGYSLMHAAASYNHLDLLRILVHEFHVDVNIRDEDNETCLFVTETVEAAKCLVEELHIDRSAKNDEDMTAQEKFESECDFPEIAAYLHADADGQGNGSAPVQNGHLPPLPPNVRVNFGAISDMPEGDANAQEPDPEFRRRIEELASRENFHTEQGQRELRDLITDAVRDVSQDDRNAQRRRVG